MSKSCKMADIIEDFTGCDRDLMAEVMPDPHELCRDNGILAKPIHIIDNFFLALMGINGH